jgi:hypothetical protein
MFHEYNKDLEESAWPQDCTMERKVIRVGRFKTLTHITQIAILKTNSPSAWSVGIPSGVLKRQSESADRG